MIEKVRIIHIIHTPCEEYLWSGFCVNDMVFACVFQKVRWIDGRSWMREDMDRCIEDI